MKKAQLSEVPIMGLFKISPHGLIMRKSALSGGLIEARNPFGDISWHEPIMEVILVESDEE